MGKIVQLNQYVSNQIAAGEVVERPASVIKELIENSLDAKARTIEIRIKSGGYEHLVVQDDGIGMDEEDVALSVHRYATSKLRNASDLFSLSTFGFRGEALPSIASISRMSIMSRIRDEAHGTRAVIDAGAITELSKAGCAMGTRVEVRDLFFNVPARLKFARSKRAEAAEIDRLIRAFLFIHPHIGWKFFVDDKLVLSFSAAEEDTGLERAQALLGKDTNGFLYTIACNTELIKLSGAVAAPMVIRHDARNIVLFVNNRLINDRKLVAAIKASFRTLLEVGRSPICALNLEISPEDVDVNVHPRKAEVRFKDERRVFAHLTGELGQFLAQTPWLRGASGSAATLSFSPGYDFKRESFDVLLKPAANDASSYRSHNFVIAEKNSFTGQSASKRLLSAASFSDLLVVGQIRATYLLTESEEGLVIIDQHAAHERVMFEKIRKEYKNLSASPLLLPISIQLDFSEMMLFLEHLEAFQALGIEAEVFGDNSVIIRAVPDFLKKSDIRSFMLGLLSDFTHQGRGSSADALIDRTLATMACHSSIRAGQRLSKQEIEALLKELDGIDFNAQCPHGRPIVKSFSGAEIKKWFDRP